MFEFRHDGSKWLVVSPKGEWTCADWLSYVMDFCTSRFPNLDDSPASYRMVFNLCDTKLVATQHYVGYTKGKKTSNLSEDPVFTRSWMRLALDYAQSYVYCESLRVGKSQGLSAKDTDKLAAKNHSEFSQYLVGNGKLFSPG